jgi:hypothetical protein
MKIRMGFVSNSSSSSFIVHAVRVEHRTQPKPNSEGRYPATEIRTELLTTDQLEVLTKLGFRRTVFSDPFLYEFLRNGRAELDKREGLKVKDEEMMSDIFGVYYGMGVVCNPQDVVSPLVGAGIAFRMAHHYGHELVMWEPWKASLLVLKNPGLMYSMYDHESEMDLHSALDYVTNILSFSKLEHWVEPKVLKYAESQRKIWVQAHVNDDGPETGFREVWW